MTPQDFINAISTAAQQSGQSSGVPASFTVAEAAIESGWGAHAPGMNLFGIKADPSWTGPVTIQNTREFLNGAWTMVQAKFRAYTTWLGSISDHAAFLLDNPRYSPAFAFKDGRDFARAIAVAGYATDPQYASKIISIIDAHNLLALDAPKASQ